MHYYIYKITNLLNDKIYIGVHKTKNLDDGYMGSGQIIKDAIIKYGIDNFKKEILQEFLTEDEMYSKEKELVNIDFVRRKDTYNLAIGGLGQYGGIAFADRLNEDKEFAKQWAERVSQQNKAGRKGSFNDPEHLKKVIALSKTDEALTKMKNTMKEKEHQKGVNNSQYGKRFMWVTDGISSIKLNLTSEIPEGWIRGKTQKNSLKVEV
jgi:hypothetical protein